MRAIATAPRYLAVGTVCAALNNVVLIGGDSSGLPLAASIGASFAIVCVVGYILHAAVTFGVPASWPGLGRYVLAMAASLPVSALLLWAGARALGLPMMITAPCATVATLLVNFFFSRWAFTHRSGNARRSFVITDTIAAFQTDAPITPESVAATLGRHFGLYRRRKPQYQTTMLRTLRDLWRGYHDRLLDVGGGTGVIAQCIAELFPVGAVTSVDVEDRFCGGLTIQHRTYDGQRLPFADGVHDAATINNVVHHIPEGVRLSLFRDVARVVDGPLYIKDHVSGGLLDDARLTVLDMIGNLAFAGMVRAQYLSMAQWEALAAGSGYRIAELRSDIYRHGLFALLFPNHLEITMRWERR